ncbi:MAG: c-type cytochrome [Myxococcota bacterium]|jgi:ubiquinol-cytochrome c reductase cytochrome c subunit
MTRDRAEARLLSRILRIGLLLALLGQIAWSFRPEPSRAQTDQQAQGQALYEANCSTCHGLQAEGTANGPSLQNAGPAAVDFMLSTGRMPLANPGDQPVRDEPKFTPEQTAAIVAYVETIAPGGEPIPTVDPAAGDLARGAEVFLNTCAGCHGAGATGDSVGGGQIAPTIDPANPTQIGEAIRIGPGLMPRFGPETIDQADLDSVAAYLLWIRDHGQDGGLQLGRVGAVAEGLVIVVVGLGLMILFLRLTGAKT